MQSFFSKSYPHSWLGHFLLFLALSFILKSFGQPWTIPLTAAITIELTQFDIYRFQIKWYDYVVDFVADGTAIILVYCL